MPFSFITVTAVLLSSILSTPCRATVAHAFHVRPLQARIRLALDLSYASSPTIRRLVGELESSDVIVHLVARPEGPGPQGTLRFVSATPPDSFASPSTLCSRIESSVR